MHQMNPSENSKTTCPKSLGYSAQANITPDKDFENDISLFRKKAEQAYVGALVRFHNRCVERLRIKLCKLEQAKSRNKDRVTIVTKNKSSTHSAARTNATSFPGLFPWRFGTGGKRPWHRLVMRPSYTRKSWV